MQSGPVSYHPMTTPMNTAIVTTLPVPFVNYTTLTVASPLAPPDCSLTSPTPAQVVPFGPSAKPAIMSTHVKKKVSSVLPSSIHATRPDTNSANVTSTPMQLQPVQSPLSRRQRSTSPPVARNAMGSPIFRPIKSPLSTVPTPDAAAIKLVAKCANIIETDNALRMVNPNLNRRFSGFHPRSGNHIDVWATFDWDNKELLTDGAQTVVLVEQVADNTRAAEAPAEAKHTMMGWSCLNPESTDSPNENGKDSPCAALFVTDQPDEVPQYYSVSSTSRESLPAARHASWA